MMLRHLHAIALAALLATAAEAQQRPIFDPDDQVDPRQHGDALFISRLALGAGTDVVDDYRPFHSDAGFLLFTNSLYWKRIQFDYKHSKVLGINDKTELQSCGCQHPIYFPTPPAPDSTPAPPPASSRETLQFGWYYSVPGRATEPPVVLRLRLTGSRQSIDTVIRSFPTQQVVERRSGREHSFGIDTDTYFRIGRHNVWGELFYARTARSGTTDNRSQNELAYISRFPAWAVGPLLVRAMLTVGAVSNRGAAGLNVVNPAFEAFWHLTASRANLHLVWSPQSTRSGNGGWETHQQIALFADRALYVHLFGRSTPSADTAR